METETALDWGASLVCLKVDHLVILSVSVRVWLMETETVLDSEVSMA